jgi:rRNA-processing protein FCF1
MKIIIDTNFLIYASKYKIDLAAELYRLYGKYEIILPRTVFIEVQKLEKSRGNGKFTAKLALIIIKKLLEDKRLKIIGTDSKNADEEIIRLLGMPEIKKEKIIVGTMDRELADRIKKSAGILKIRQKRYLSE